MNENEKKVTIYSYSKVWKVKKRIHSFNNLKLPVPLDPVDLLSFAGCALLMLLLGKLIPPFEKVPGILRYFALPYLTTKIFFNLKPDGKNTFKYIAGCARYALTTAGSYTENFKKHPAKTGTVKLKWNCSMGVPK